MPLEEEITSLKEQLHIANQLLREAAMNTVSGYAKLLKKLVHGPVFLKIYLA